MSLRHPCKPLGAPSSSCSRNELPHGNSVIQGNSIIHVWIGTDNAPSQPVVTGVHEALTQGYGTNISLQLTLTVLVTTIDAQWEGMGDVGSARYEPALLPPCPTIRVLSYSN